MLASEAVETPSSWYL